MDARREIKGVPIFEPVSVTRLLPTSVVFLLRPFTLMADDARSMRKKGGPPNQEAYRKAKGKFKTFNAAARV